MRRFVASTTAFLLITISIWAASPGVALADTSGDWTYTVSGAEAVVTGYTGAGGSIAVPDTLGGLPVTRIGPRAFEGLASLVMVTVPGSVTEIGDGAFRECASLTTVCLPDNITAIEADTFRGCVGLIYVDMPGNLRSIGEYAFGGCVSYRAATLPRWVETIAPHAYDGCAMLHRGFFYGAPPAMDTTSFQGVTPDFTCYYHISQTGWGGFTAYPCGPFCRMTVEPMNGAPAKEGVSPIVGRLLATVPMDPVWAGHAFGGWYREAACVNAWDFASDIIDGDVTLYAKWMAMTHTVSFDSRGGSAVPSISAPWGAIIEPPEDPARDGYFFGGWYKEAACTNAWNFYADTVTGDTTLFARWLTPGVPASLSARSASISSIALSWRRPANATGVEIYRSSSLAGVYKHIGTASDTSFTDTGLTLGRTYYYKVRSYKQLETVKLVSDYSPAVSAKPSLSPPRDLKAAGYTGKMIKLSWEKVPGAEKYEIWRSVKSPGSFKFYKEALSAKYDDSNVDAGIDYYYKVRAYRVVDGKKVYSDYSNTAGAKP